MALICTRKGKKIKIKKQETRTLTVKLMLKTTED